MLASGSVSPSSDSVGCAGPVSTGGSLPDSDPSVSSSVAIGVTNGAISSLASTVGVIITLGVGPIVGADDATELGDACGPGGIIDTEGERTAAGDDSGTSDGVGRPPVPSLLGDGDDDGLIGGDDGLVGGADDDGGLADGDCVPTSSRSSRRSTADTERHTVPLMSGALAQTSRSSH